MGLHNLEKILKDPVILKLSFSLWYFPADFLRLVLQSLNLDVLIFFHKAKSSIKIIC